MVYSQNSGQFIEASQDITIPFTVTQYSTKHGLPQSQVADIKIKKNGNLIIATSNGIVEYNGYEFKNFIKTENYKSYNYRELFWHEGANKLFAKSQGTLFELYPQFKQVCTGSQYCMVGDSLYAIDTKGNISSSSVYTINFKLRSISNLSEPHAIFKTSNAFMVGTTAGLMKYNPKTKSSEKIVDDVIIRFKENPYSKDLYALSSNKVHKITGSKGSIVLDVSVSNPDAICQDIDFIDEVEFFVATHNGLYQVTPDYSDCYTKTSALPSQFIESLYYDKKENCLFTGTGEKGLLKLQLKTAYTFYANQGINPNASLSSILKTKSGEVLLAENLGNIYKIGIDSATPYTKVKATFASLAEIDDEIYAGTWGAGVMVLKNKELVAQLTAKLELPDNNVHSAYKDKQGNIWIGTSNGIAKGTKRDNIRPFLSTQIKRNIITFYELKNGTLCIGGNEGVYMLDKNHNIIKHIGSDMGLEGKEVRSFYEDKETKLWIGTYDGGLYCYHNNKLTNINKLKNAMLDKDAFCLANDNLGYLYITSNHGLWRLNEKDLNDFYYGKKKYLIPFHYEEEAGILNTEFNGGFQNNYLKTSRNHFYFPSLQGVIIVTPEEPSYRKLLPVIDKVIINDTLIEGQISTLNRNTYSIDIVFSSANFLSKYNVYYQYKLENNKGNSVEWSKPQKENYVNFKLLPPGEYTFSVRTIDAFNDNAPNVTVYKFTILAHFYETKWFIISCIVLFFVLTVIFGRLRVQMYRRQAEQKETLSKQYAQLELKALQAQLNPHFIFNAMNTIKYFIMEKDFEKANDGLNKLSYLIRSCVEDSERLFVSLEEEFELISTYLDLEKMRLQDQFEYHIHFDTEIDRNTIIPHLLIQSFVENAVKHGIYNLEDKIGELNIAVKKENKWVVISIEDNGIGREASYKLKKKSHISKGLELVKDKSEFLKKFENYQIETTTIDLHDHLNNAIGTKVIIKFPL